MTVIRYKKLEHHSSSTGRGAVIQFPRAGNVALAPQQRPVVIESPVIELIEIFEEPPVFTRRNRKSRLERKIEPKLEKKTEKKTEKKAEKKALKEEARRAFWTYVLTMVGLAVLTFC